jgi:hypothetical protein
MVQDYATQTNISNYQYPLHVDHHILVVFDEDRQTPTGVRRVSARR